MHQEQFFTPQLAGKACQLGCPNIVLDHVCVCVCNIYMCPRDGWSMNIAIGQTV